MGVFGGINDERFEPILMMPFSLLTLFDLCFWQGVDAKCSRGKVKRFVFCFLFFFLFLECNSAILNFERNKEMMDPEDLKKMKKKKKGEKNFANF